MTATIQTREIIEGKGIESQAGRERPMHQASALIGPRINSDSINPKPNPRAVMQALYNPAEAQR